MKIPRLSFIILTYNPPQLLRQAVDSVGDKTIQYFEWIRVDDASITAIDLAEHPHYL